MRLKNVPCMNVLNSLTTTFRSKVEMELKGESFEIKSRKSDYAFISLRAKKSHRDLKHTERECTTTKGIKIEVRAII